MDEAPGFQATLKVAEAVQAALAEEHAQAVLIGALALAVHGYPRDTVDLDLAVAIDPRALHRTAETLRLRGFEVQVRDPDPDDPLGGVLDVRAPDADLVQVVNFLNPPSGGFPRLVEDALANAVPLGPGTPIRVVDAYHLIAFKLYAGGPKSTLDILELLDRNPGIDLARLQRLCEGYRLGDELKRVLALRHQG